MKVEDFGGAAFVRFRVHEILRVLGRSDHLGFKQGNKSGVRASPAFVS